jgi:hypothetical protein
MTRECADIVSAITPPMIAPPQACSISLCFSSSELG